MSLSVRRYSTVDGFLEIANLKLVKFLEDLRPTDYLQRYNYLLQN